MYIKQLFRILILLSFGLTSITTVFASSTPVFSEYVTNGTLQQVWKIIGTTETMTTAHADTTYPAGQVFPNPSGDNWAMKLNASLTGVGDAGVVSGDEAWTDMLISAQVFINVDATQRHDTVLGGRMAVASPSWGTGVRGGYFTYDMWSGLPVPCWATRDGFAGPTNAVHTTYSSNGWHQIILVFSGTTVDMYVDMSYAAVVNGINASTQTPLITTSASGTNGGVGFFTCYQKEPDLTATGESAYIDDIEVYQPPYEIPVLALSPTSVNLGKEKTQQFAASGGTPPYSWGLSTLNFGSINTTAGAIVTFTSTSAGTVYLTVTDSDPSSPQQQTATITVVPTTAPLFLNQDKIIFSRKELFN